MNKQPIKYKIKIMKGGPYLVTGGVPLAEQIIVPDGDGYVYKPGRALPQAETYVLCRCGRSRQAPFCDGAHTKTGFRGTETASRADYLDRAALLPGPGVDLLDDSRCAYARFCHRDSGNAWDLAANSTTPYACEEAVRAASDCPAGRLTAVAKDGTPYEPALKPSIDVLQDEEEEVSSALFVKGGIPIESADGTLYETRNRVTLCRCGRSQNKPFCDASHVSERYRDR